MVFFEPFDDFDTHLAGGEQRHVAVWAGVSRASRREDDDVGNLRKLSCKIDRSRNGRAYVVESAPLAIGRDHAVEIEADSRPLDRSRLFRLHRHLTQVRRTLLRTLHLWQFRRPRRHHRLDRIAAVEPFVLIGKIKIIDPRIMRPRVMTPGEPQRVGQIVGADGAFWREYLGLSRQTKIRPVAADLIRKIVNIRERILVVKQNPNVKSALAVRIEHERIHSFVPQTLGPFEDRRLIRLDYLVRVTHIFVVQIDVDREPLTRRMIRYRMQPDQMCRRTPREMAFELGDRDHVGPELSPFLDRQHHHRDTVVLDRVLTPNVPPIHDPLHRPLGQSRSITYPLLRDPKQPLVTGKFNKRLSSHDGILAYLC